MSSKFVLWPPTLLITLTRKISISDYPTQSRNVTRTVTTTDLLCWSFQIARGMQYLTSRNVLHGNLAARNVLLSENDVVKITDFGFDRAVHKSNIYLEKRQVKLESQKNTFFSSK